LHTRVHTHEHTHAHTHTHTHTRTCTHAHTHTHTLRIPQAAYSGTMTGGTRTLSKVTPFGKECNFSKTMSEHSKVVVDE
jgi:hypothetical protein